MNRKLKKLIKTPRLYFVDMFKKKLAKGTLPKIFSPMLKVQGNHKFSVVSAVYGVEKYLEQYLTSLESQTLNFVDHIELIMVDDGSPDGSANIIKKWVAKYPDNIKYIKKENGGQASARNVGMEYVSHDWVTFIDPDDFVDMNYFAEVDKFLSKESDIDLVSCNFIFYMEDTDRFSDSHPMKYRFRDQETILNIDNMGKHVQLSVNSAFFRKNTIIKHALKMGEKIKPAFEDAHFVNKYLLLLEEDRFIGFIKGAKYYYRKRADNSSTLDSTWINPLHYSDKLELGSLDLLRFSEATKGFIPQYIQRTALYDYFWYIRYIVNHSEHLSFLSQEERDKFLSLSHEIFSLIDIDVINSFDLAGCWFFHKVGMLGLFKGAALPFQIVYVKNYDPVKNLLQLKYYYSESMLLESIQLDGKDVIPAYVKTREHDFLSRTFVKERIIWVPLGESSKELVVSIGGLKTLMTFAGKQYNHGISIQNIINHFARKKLDDGNFPQYVRLLRREAGESRVTSRYHKSWLFMDRDTNADDNAEHLYRYVVKSHPDINAFFILRNTSHDWQRLENEGFRLINFDSRAHKLALLNAEHVISSHVDHYVISLLEGKWYSDLLRFRFTFLQHGVTQNDLSNWLNGKSIDMFVTATQQEFNSIAEGVNRYKFTRREVSLTGFPRHDALLKLNDEIATEKLVVIMPTWRQGIVGESIGQGNDRDINDKFYSSDYAQAWKSFLHSTELKEKATANGFKVVFFPHTNIQPYLHWFDTPEYISTISHESIHSMQDLFCRASILVTDYSSVAFEMAYINKCTLYYQFDYDFVFGGGHTTSKGYYDYEKDGFGSVYRNEADLITGLSKFFANDSKLEDIYIDRITDTFVRRDGLSCKRIFEAVKKLDEIEIFDVNNKLCIAEEFAKSAMEAGNWLLASKRWKYLLTHSNLSDEQIKEAGHSLIYSCRRDGKLSDAQHWIEELSNNKQLEKLRLIVDYYKWEEAFNTVEKAHSSMEVSNWQAAFKYWNKITPELSTPIYIDSVFYKIESLVNLKKWKEVSEIFKDISTYNLSEEDLLILKGWERICEGNWDASLDFWKNAKNVNKPQSLTLVEKVEKYRLQSFLEKGDYSNYLHSMLKAWDLHKDASEDFLEKINTAVNELNIDFNFLTAVESDFSSDEKKRLKVALNHYNFTKEARYLLDENLTKSKRYSVIASVYGVEKYLDDFFISIISQSIGFEKNIELIIIDDGSTDGSAEIIKKWQQHYPDNILYHYKTNGGLSSARNTGLEYVTTNWVSFIDPDDFVAETYFEEVDSFLLGHPNEKFGMISCNSIFYLEKEDRLSNTHALAFRFEEKQSIFEIPNLENHFQLAVNSAFLRTDIITENELQMDSRIKPTFEDAHFLGRYLLEIPGYKVAFLREAKYFYRKREDSTSLIDASWNKVEQYTTKLKYGYLDLLELSKKRNQLIPEYLQRTVLYDLLWYVKYIVNHSERLAFLDSQEKKAFIRLIKEIFSHIDTDVIDKFNLAGCWFYHKVGMLGTFKSELPSFQIVYVEEVDLLKNLVKLRYFYYGSLPLEQLTLDQVEVTPVYVKTCVHNFVDEIFVNERFIWLPLSKESKTLRVNIGDLKTRLTFAGKQHYNGVPTDRIIKYFERTKLNDQNFPVSIRFLRRLATSPVTSKPYHNAWVFMDRDTQADDNAEHLYRYVVKYHPDVNAFFVLRNSSHDWQRLEEEGFRLLDFDSRAHKLALLNADHLISSHVDHYVVSLLDQKWFSDILTYHYTFLQHGITKDDLSNWLNSKSIDLFATATAQEFASIANDNNRYKYSRREVSLTGFPRHDALLQMNGRVETEKLIVVMPTWRQGIVGTTIGQGNERGLNEEFYDSDYAQCWKSFLHSGELKHQAITHGYTVVFFPHANINPYLDWFETPDYIKTLSHGDIDSMQHLFCRAALMITDYSSVAFEMAYINKAIIYYQFDYDFVFGGGHLTSKGYYDYERDGFGPVCFKQDQVLEELALLLNNNALPDEHYKDRMKDTFVHRDGLCCQRVYENILSLKDNM